MVDTVELDRRIDDNFDRLLDLVADKSLSREQRHQERMHLLEQLLSDTEEHWAREQKRIKEQGWWVGKRNVASSLYAAERHVRTLQKSARTLASIERGVPPTTIA